MTTLRSDIPGFEPDMAVKVFLRHICKLEHASDPDVMTQQVWKEFATQMVNAESANRIIRRIQEFCEAEMGSGS